MLNQRVARAIRTLKGEPIGRGVVELTSEYLQGKMTEYLQRLRKLRAKYGSKKKLEDKVLKEEHTWDEETALFDWESLELELKKLGQAAKELGV